MISFGGQTRAEGPHGGASYARGAKRNRIDHSRTHGSFYRPLFQAGVVGTACKLGVGGPAKGDEAGGMVRTGSGAGARVGGAVQGKGAGGMAEMGINDAAGVGGLQTRFVSVFVPELNAEMLVAVEDRIGVVPQIQTQLLALGLGPFNSRKNKPSVCAMFLIPPGHTHAPRARMGVRHIVRADEQTKPN